MSRASLPALLGLRIQGEKIVGYLLDPAHPRGGSKASGSKAKLFLRFGSAAAQPSTLADALVQHDLSAPNADLVHDTVGFTRIICEGPIVGVDSREPWIRSVRPVELDLYGRIITVVPLPGRHTSAR